ncbi:undecaprenyl-diphosphatase [Variovorax boronicumulans]|jgi:undecaprenyl-diphosphatase|uniref:Undecaprenyl-diphosphatase n=2 Tax=Variovorax TaxID=34072 RepID=A0AAW8CSJ2_9BURK|nr:MULTISPECIES: phosphatase PAP2 family protein [Variovorax]ADU36549.1 phosphoesterase PA-phosphatase related protein [Variovorax paradoxus EPS]MDP9894448.1 undecaprenyl-diphosphatase [Variovorax boronicumulans]MDP9992812.1 undecaprenyl-diphosphatase [Variovorax boronicumulans]MDQ0004097.1 undecaprenyl-diphosphatase [Variovorax boronicumulans]MDQ0054267.1 undecaprenyl-diphosphatase [Variovorax boronicumulans]
MQALDFALFGWLNADASAPLWLIEFARFASEVLPALLAVTIIASAMFDKRWRYALFTALVSVIATWVIVNVFRSALPFPRPAFFGLGIQWEPQGMRPGFPSLHAAGTFAAAFSLWCLPQRAPMLAALAVAAVVAWSRLYLGVHFPSDIAAAVLLAALVSIMVERGVSRPLSLALARMPARRRLARARRTSLNAD